MEKTEKDPQKSLQLAQNHSTFFNVHLYKIETLQLRNRNGLPITFLNFTFCMI